MDRLSRPSGTNVTKCGGNTEGVQENSGFYAPNYRPMWGKKREGKHDEHGLIEKVEIEQPS